MSVLQLIDHRLSAKVREIYGPHMENEKFLMDFKSDILANTTKMLEDMDCVDCGCSGQCPESTIQQDKVQQQQETTHQATV